MPAQPDTRVQCPYCERRYAQNVADRHIPRCKDIVNRPKPPPSKASVLNKSKNEALDRSGISKRSHQRSPHGSSNGATMSKSTMQRNTISNNKPRHSNLNSTASPNTLATESRNPFAAIQGIRPTTSTIKQPGEVYFNSDDGEHD